MIYVYNLFMRKYTKARLDKNIMSLVVHNPTISTRQKVVDLKCSGANDEDIARYMCINVDTLRKYYASELHDAFLDTRALLAERLVNIAQNEGDVSAALKAIQFWLRHRGGWKSADKETEIDAINQQTAAIERKAELDDHTAQLRNHLRLDAALKTEASTDERS